MTMWALVLRKFSFLNKNKSIFYASILLIFLLIFSSATEVQETIWLDKDFNETIQEKAVYYRPSPRKVRSKFMIIDYYKNGNKYREGKAKSTVLNREEFNGVLTYYHKNGIVSKKVSYQNGKKDGIFYEYFDTGELNVEGKYENNLEEGTWKIYYRTGKIKSKGKYREGEKVGVWKTYYKNVYYSEDE